MSKALLKRDREKPPYLRYAFFNPYNLSLLGGAMAATLATGHWWVGLFAFAAEAIWMLFAPDSRLLQKLWFDKVWLAEQAERRRKRQAEKFNALPDVEKARALALRQLQRRIQKLAEDNPSFTVELLREDVNKLEDLVEDFLDLATTCVRYEEHLAQMDIEAVERDLRRFQAQVDTLPVGDERRSVAQKNLQVLLQRKDRWKELRRNLQTARGQMDLMENTFRLLADEIVTMKSPTELGDRLDQMREGVEAVRQTARETERLLTAVERT
ncbi:MAG: hypothetical protein RMK29_03590 [Myxococcales bacterium]|nr:hypothetical protein [Myxococcota bacterium]MDW8280769.1 hypothetical protein [Myxococcales bacterium]